MKIVAISVVRNEADVIELFVRHHLCLVDRMLVVNHLSTDRTAEILGALRAEGAPLEISDETRPRFVQGDVTTGLMRRAVEEFGADWIVPLDADEFLASDAASAVRPELERLDPGEAHRIPWRTYVPTPADPADSLRLFDRIRHRRRVEGQPHSKVVISGALARRRGMSLSTGSHELVERRFGRRRRKYQGSGVDRLHLAHFPVRSPVQITAKSLAGWIARQASSEVSGDKNWHFRPLFERLRSGRLPEPEELTEYALAYAVNPEIADDERDLVLDPVRSPVNPGDLVYTAPFSADPLAIVTDLALQLAEELDRRGPSPGGTFFLRRRRRC